jgi:hypothetical protein
MSMEKNTTFPTLYPSQHRRCIHISYSSIAYSSRRKKMIYIEIREQTDHTLYYLLISLHKSLETRMKDITESPNLTD